MIDYLNESYNGELINPLTTASYYCYTLKDIQTGKFYSGSRGISGENKHDLLTKYFTSSIVIDFKKKLKEHPELFQFRIEYFKSRSLAFAAEVKFHQQHNVGKNPQFINSRSAGSSNCGAGSLLCKDANGNIYRITVEEYKKGGHSHISKGLMNIRTENGIEKINVADFDPNVHVTEFKNHVMVLDTITGIRRRIPMEVFKKDTRFVGITSGKVMAFDKLTNQNVMISREEFHNLKNRYAGVTQGLTTVIDKSTGERITIQKESYDRKKYAHFNMGKVCAYSLLLRKNVSITREEFIKNANNYANLATKFFYKVDNNLFKSKEMLDEYYRKTRGKSIGRLKQDQISENFIDVETISKEEHQNGKD